jgi:hypothetical protein
MLDTLENHYIYKITKQGKQINEMLTNENNSIYEFLNKYTETNLIPNTNSPPFPIPHPLTLSITILGRHSPHTPEHGIAPKAQTNCTQRNTATQIKHTGKMRI